MRAVSVSSLVDVALTGRRQLHAGQVVSVACDLAGIGELGSKKRRVAIDYCHKLTCRELGIYEQSVRSRRDLDAGEQALLEELAWRVATEWRAVTSQLGAVAWAGPFRREEIMSARDLARFAEDPPAPKPGPRQRLSGLAHGTPLSLASPG